MKAYDAIRARLRADTPEGGEIPRLSRQEITIINYYEDQIEHLQSQIDLIAKFLPKDPRFKSLSAYMNHKIDMASPSKMIDA